MVVVGLTALNWTLTLTNHLDALESYCVPKVLKKIRSRVYS